MTHIARQTMPPTVQSGSSSSSLSTSSVSESSTSSSSSSSSATIINSEITTSTLISSTSHTTSPPATSPTSRIPPTTSHTTTVISSNFTNPSITTFTTIPSVQVSSNATSLVGSLPGNDSLVTPTITENMTTIVTTVNGQATTITSALPTNLATATANSSNSSRTAIITGTTIAAVLLLCGALAGLYSYRKRKLGRSLAYSERKREGKGLLSGEEFEDDDDPFATGHKRVPPTSYTYQSPFNAPTVSTTSSAPNMLRARVSENGSIFREEVWPPPGFVDPITERSSQVNLSGIVDDVMGPVPAKNPDHTRSESLDSSMTAHSRDPTGSSTTPLLRVANSTENDNTSLYQNPFDSVYPGTNHLPPGAQRPVTPGASNSTKA